MKKTRILALFLLTVLLLTGTASAMYFDSANNRFDFAGNVIADKNVEGDYIAFGATVKLESGVTGDIIAGGRNIIITDDNAVQNIYAAGQYINVRAKSARNIYAAGVDITVNAGTDVKGAYLVGGTISFGGTAVDAYMTGASITVDGTIYENLVIRSDHITFGKNVTVNGHVTIYATVKPELPPTIDEAKVTYKRVMHMGKGNIDLSERGISRIKVIMAAVGVVTAVFIALLLTLFRGGYFKAKALEFRKTWGKMLLFGLIAFIVIPIAALVCMLTVFAIPLCLIVLILFGIILYLSPVVTGSILGRRVMPKMNRFLSVSIGAAAISLLLHVPYLKIALFLACAFYTLGIAVMSLRPRREAKTLDIRPKE
jgi:hypothetical protein